MSRLAKVSEAQASNLNLLDHATEGHLDALPFKTQGTPGFAGFLLPAAPLAERL